MLILTRRVGESLRIGDEVSVTVLGIKGSQENRCKCTKKCICSQGRGL